MKNKLIIAIDPGAKGATAVRYPDGKTAVFPFISESEQRESVLNLEAYCRAEKCKGEATIEHVDGFCGNASPGSAMFNFGRNFGFHLGLLAGCGFSVELVRPSVWQKGFPKTAKIVDKAKAKREHKAALKEIAARKFPEIKVTLANADALLILDWATRDRN